MRVLFLVVVLLSSWEARAEEPCELFSVQLRQEKTVNVSVQAFSEELADQTSAGGFSLSIVGELYVEGSEEIFNDLPTFASCDELFEQVHSDYCHQHLRPEGTIFFRAKDPRLIPPVAVGHGSIKALKNNFSIRVGYEINGSGVVASTDIDCKF